MTSIIEDMMQIEEHTKQLTITLKGHTTYFPCPKCGKRDITHTNTWRMCFACKRKYIFNTLGQMNMNGNRQHTIENSEIRNHTKKCRYVGCNNIFSRHAQTQYCILHRENVKVLE